MLDRPAAELLGAADAVLVDARRRQARGGLAGGRVLAVLGEGVGGRHRVGVVQRAPEEEAADDERYDQRPRRR